MRLPLIIVNFKVYEQATGDSAISLAKIHEKVAQETGASIGIAVSHLDLAAVARAVDIPVFAQHIDPVNYGGYTGHVLPQMVKEAGAYGTLLNHAEYPIENRLLKDSIAAARDAELFAVVCANSPEFAGMVLEWGPDLIAVEPPELIGGDISVSKAGPHIIEEAFEAVGREKLLVGAGVKDADDVRIALALGAVGVLLASGVTKSDDPYTVLLDLVSGLK
jgi:triosephosphate isomerase